MPLYKTNGTAETGGQTIGVLCVDECRPFIPGDANNASSYGFPVTYKRVPDMRSVDILAGDYRFLPRLLEAARELEAEGVRGIIGNSGYLLHYQEQLSEAVNIPVATSSLLQIPLVASSIAPEQPIGILAAAAPLLSKAFFREAAIAVPNPLAIYGLQDAPSIQQLLQGFGVSENTTGYADAITLDPERVSADIVQAARCLLADNPDTGAIILECSAFPPYARAVQEATGLPVFDILTLANLLFGVTHPRRYQGYV